MKVFAYHNGLNAVVSTLPIRNGKNILNFLYATHIRKYLTYKEWKEFQFHQNMPNL